MEASTIKCLLRSWGHSHEEDSGGVEVWRPAGFRFPLARGRDWLELLEDGRAAFTGPGPDDRYREAAGSWVATGDDEFELRRSADAPPRRFAVIECDSHVLRLRPR